MPNAVQPKPPRSSLRGDGGAVLGRQVERQATSPLLGRGGSVAATLRACGMPTVSGETLALPPSNGSQALACTAGNTAFCAASPDGRRELRAAARRVLLDRLALADVLGPDLLDRRDHFVGHALRDEDAEVVGRRREAGQRLRQRLDRAVAFELERLVARPSASGRSRLPRIISACSTASCVVTSVSPATVATTAGLPPS